MVPMSGFNRLLSCPLQLFNGTLKVVVTFRGAMKEITFVMGLRHVWGSGTNTHRIHVRSTMSYFFLYALRWDTLGLPKKFGKFLGHRQNKSG